MEEGKGKEKSYKNKGNRENQRINEINQKLASLKLPSAFRMSKGPRETVSRSPLWHKVQEAFGGSRQA